MKEPDLFDITAGKHGNAETSVAANRSLAHVKGELCKQVFGFIQQSGGATLEETANALGMKIQTASARVSELLRDGFIADTGKRRPTSSGRAARVLRVSV